MKYLLLLIFFATPQLVLADIYMQKDQNNNVIYTDSPDKNAQKIQVTAPPLHDTPKPTTTPETTSAPTSTTVVVQKNPYKVFGITSPLDQGTIQNDPNIMITFTVNPPLQTGDKIQVFLDDKAIGLPVASTQISIGRLDRGIHTVKGAIIDSNQKILKLSQTITIYVHYAHI
jgi:hypothetical protein